MIDFHCRQSEQFLEFWKGLAKSGLIPKSSDFFPEDIPRLLPFITIYELVSKDEIRFKLAGTSIGKRDGFDRTGDNYLDQVAPERRAKAAEAFWAFHDQPCAMRVVLQLEVSSGASIVIEGLGLPFANDKGGYPLVYYVNHEVEKLEPTSPMNGRRLELITVLQRDFIDLGAGVPTFKD